ncbi:MAG: ArsA family ATPase [Actinomycetota bacterium]
MTDLKSMFIPKNSQIRSIFFAGKGGVGKTTISCITAVKLAEEGYRTLLLTTDPASHLSEVFEQEIGSIPTKIKGVENLQAARIDQEKAVVEYKERILGDARGKYTEDVLAMMEEQLDSPCTEEMAAFDKFVEYASSSDYEVIVFDTAPTGHTLRLLELPVDWSKQLELQAGGTAITNELNKQAQERFEQVIERMRNPEKTTFTFVVYPEHTPIIEAWRAAEELKEIGVPTKLVVANFVLLEERCTADFFRKRFQMQQEHLKELGKKFKAPVVTMPLLDDEVMGLSNLKKAAQILFNAK